MLQSTDTDGSGLPIEDSDFKVGWKNEIFTSTNISFLLNDISYVNVLTDASANN